MKPWPTDVARHTFASNLYALIGDIGKVSSVLTHTGSRVTLKHYVAKGVKREDADAYFSTPISRTAVRESKRYRQRRGLRPRRQ